jgi:hypothetical protein
MPQPVNLNVNFLFREESQDKLMRTEGEFCTLMEVKGMTKEWAKREFARRWGLPGNHWQNNERSLTS